MLKSNREGQAFLLVFPVSSLASFDKIKELHRTLRVTKKNPIFLLIGNKCDIESGLREVAVEDGLCMAQSLGCSYMEVSAKLDTNIVPMFEALIRALRQNRLGQTPPAAHAKTAPKSRKCNIAECVVV